MTRCSRHKRYEGRGFPQSKCRECLDVHVDYWRNVSRDALAKAEVGRDALKVDCPHEDRYRASYQWEHDNGYGRQRWVDGKYCKACGKQWPWGWV